jgi:hypothetical protein
MSSVVGFYYGRKLRLTRYALRYNKKNWRDKRIDLGTLYLDGVQLKPYLVKGVVVLGGLNGSGGKVATGTKPSVLEFALYEEVAFADFLRI